MSRRSLITGIVGVTAAVMLLWWSTAMEDAEWALWRRYSSATVFFNLILSGLIVAGFHILRRPDRRVQRLARVIVLTGSVLVTLAALELPAVLLKHDYGRTLRTHENDTWLQLATGVNRFDPELIHVHQPYFRYRGKVRGNLARLGIPHPPLHDVDIAYDRNGFRNGSDFTAVDMVAVGDSFIEGAETPAAETVASRIGRHLNRSMLNLGQSGYGPQQELVALTRYGIPLAPKAVVWFVFGGNDLSDAVTYEWRREHLDDLLGPPPFVTRSFTRNMLLATARLTTPERATPSPSARMHAAEFVRRDGTTETIYLDAREGPWQPREWELTTSALAHAHGLATHTGARLVVVYIPRKLRVYRDYLRAEPAAFANVWQDNDLPEVLGRWCRERGIDYLDSTIPLRAAVAAGESVYLPDDVHWTARGHAVVAQAVADRFTPAGDVVAQEDRGQK